MHLHCPFISEKSKNIQEVLRAAMLSMGLINQIIGGKRGENKWLEAEIKMKSGA